MRCNK